MGSVEQGEIEALAEDFAFAAFALSGFERVIAFGSVIRDTNVRVFLTYCLQDIFAWNIRGVGERNALGSALGEHRYCGTQEQADEEFHRVTLRSGLSFGPGSTTRGGNSLVKNAPLSPQAGGRSMIRSR